MFTKNVVHLPTWQLVLYQHVFTDNNLYNDNDDNYKTIDSGFIQMINILQFV